MANDPKVWGFNSKHKAEILSRNANKLQDLRNGGVEYTGQEVIYIKVTADGLPAQSLNDDDEMQAGVANCFEMRTGTNAILTPAPNLVEVYNFTDVEYAEGDIAKCVYVNTTLHVLSEGSGEIGLIFWLQDDMCSQDLDQDIFPEAYVQDPLNSGLVYGDMIEVRDFELRFQGAQGVGGLPASIRYDVGRGSVGFAVKTVIEVSDGEGGVEDKVIWEVRDATMPVNKIFVDISAVNGFSGEVIDVTVDESEIASDWPNVCIPNEGEEGDNSGQFILRDVANPERFCANAGTATIERTAYGEYGQGNGVCPEPLWQITNVEYPWAEYAIIQHMGGGSWQITGGMRGEDPTYSGFGVQPVDGMEVNPCLQPGEIGTALLDTNDSSGPIYRILTTNSALYGTPEKGAVVGTMQPTSSSDKGAENLVFPDGCDLSYNRVGELFMWVTPDATTTDCQTAEQVVTKENQGLQEFTVTSDVTCSPTGLTYRQSTIKVCSGTPGSFEECLFPEVPELPDYPYVIPGDPGSGIYDPREPRYPPVIPYDNIDYPTGCSPCPTGCCEYQDSNGDTQEIQTTEAGCTALGGNFAGVGVACTPDPPTDGCCTVDNGDGTYTYHENYTQAQCDSLGGTLALGQTCPDECDGSECCCGVVSDLSINLDCMVENSQFWEFQSDQEGSSDGSCVWEIEGTWTTHNGTSTGTVTVTHMGGGVFHISGTAPDGGGNITSSSGSVCNFSGCSNAGNFYVTHDEEDACIGETGDDPTGCCTGGTQDGQVVTEAECIAGGGTYDGDDTTCDPPADPTGCCYMADVTDPLHNTLQYESVCTGAGGYWAGANVNCGGAIEYCCNTLNNGQPGPYDGTQINTLACEFFGGTPNGSTPCPTNDPTGCCEGAGLVDPMVTEAECDAAGGNYLGDGQPCPDPTGCCSFSDPSQDNITTQADCAAQGGFYNGDDSTCGGGPPNQGGP